MLKVAFKKFLEMHLAQYQLVVSSLSGYNNAFAKELALQLILWMKQADRLTYPKCELTHISYYMMDG